MNVEVNPYADGISEFIKQCNSIMNGEYHKLPVDEQRALYEKLAGHFNGPIPESVQIEERAFTEQGVERRYRIYRNTEHESETLVFYIRGGGFVLGSFETHNVLLAEMCAESGLTIVAMDFRLAPEAPFPAPIDDCESILNNVIQNVDSLGLKCSKKIISGDSSGGVMAVALCMRMRDAGDDRFDGMVLFNPVLDFTRWKDGGNDAPLLTGGEMEFYTACYAPGDAVFDPQVSPLVNGKFDRLPPAYVMAAEMDSLKEDSLIFVERLQENGIEAELVVEKGLVHGAIRARGLSNTAMSAFKRGCSKLVEFSNS